MSLTSELAKKGEFYHAVLNLIDPSKAQILIKEHQQKLSKLYFPPIPGTDYPLVGMAVIYAVREFLAQKLQVSWFHETAAGRVMEKPMLEGPARYILMALGDKQARTSQNLYVYSPKSLLPSYRESIEDVAQIITSFDVILPEPEMPFIPNPSWIQADANLLMNGCLWDIRTTKSKFPLSMDNIVQQVAYLVVNRGKYLISSMGIYYSRQECFFRYPINKVLKPGFHQVSSSEQPIVDLKL
jgi:hypothetical protein